MTAMPKLQLNGVRKSYGATKALRHGGLSLDAGEVHVLIGSNGSGKSTLCKIVAGSVRPDGGEVILDGQPVEIGGPEDAKAKGIGIFYQELSLAAHRTVEENICLPSLPLSGPFADRRAITERASRYLKLFEGVTGEGFALDTPVGHLREDQRQLVEIMKTLATEAAILIFDEPTSSLDRSQVERFFSVLKQLKTEGRSVVFISHRMDEIFEIGDRVTVIRDGETVGTLKIGETDQAKVIALMVGEGATPRSEAEPKKPAATIRSQTTPRLSVSGLSGKGFRDIGFDVAPGEIVGFGGLHGQGQSSVLRALFGAAEVATGSVALNGSSVTPADPRAAIRLGFAYVSGDRGRDGVIRGRSILENVTPVHLLRAGRRFLDPADLKQKARPALEALKTVFAGYDQPVTALSGGNQQKIVIARWLVDAPQVLLLDDPTKGIDLGAKADLFALIRKLAEDGLGIVLYSSEDNELLQNADRILVFNGGRIARELAGDDRTPYNLYHAAYEAA
jgi:ribose transport system ATP-binding protein